MPQNFISRYNNLLAVKGLGSIEYTAGPNIDISDYVISGKDWTSDIDSAIQSVKGSGFSAATAWVDSQGYLTAHQDVDNLPYVQNSALEFYGVQISGISGSGFYAQSAEGAFNAETANFAYHSDTSDSATYAESAGITDSANYALTAFFANSATSSLMADTAVYAYTADKADDLTNWTYTDSAMTGIKGYNGTAFISQDLQYWDYTDSAQTAISGYHGTAFLGEDGNCPWISGNKVIGAITADFGNTVQVISSFDFSGNKNHYISLKGFNLTLPSTAGIASALDQKFDTSSFNTFIENGFNPNMTELHGATAYLSAFVNTGCVHNSALASTEDGLISSISGSGFYAEGGSSGDTTPWISGEKQIDAELALQFGQSIQMLSSFTVSGNKNHAIAVKGSIIKMPTTANIAEALMDKLDVSTFSSFSSTADVTTYSAGANIDITNHVISGKDWLSTIESGDSGKLDTSAFTAYTATAVGGIEYSGVAPVVVNNELHLISAESAVFSVQEPLYFVEDSNTATTVGIHESATMNSATVTGTAQYALTTAGWTEVQAGGGSTADVLYDHMWGSSYGIFVGNSASYRKTMLSAMNNYDKIDFIFGAEPDEISGDTYIPRPNPNKWSYGNSVVYTTVINSTGSRYVCLQTNNSGIRIKSVLTPETVPWGAATALLSTRVNNGTIEYLNNFGVVSSTASTAALCLKKVIGYKY